MKIPYFRLKVDDSAFDDEKDVTKRIDAYQMFFNIVIKSAYVDDVALMEHEKAHVRWWYYTMFFFAAIGLASGYFFCEYAYILVAISPFMQGIFNRIPLTNGWMELPGYIVQVKYAPSYYETAVARLVNKYGMNEKLMRKILKP